MRRHSPPGRSIRHQSPPRKRGRLRSLSPLSRSQPAPPGEERGRKPPMWEEPPRRDRFRNRSWDREPPFINLSQEPERHKEPLRSKPREGRSKDGNKSFRSGKEGGLKQLPIEENYLDNWTMDLDNVSPERHFPLKRDKKERHSPPPPLRNFGSPPRVKNNREPSRRDNRTPGQADFKGPNRQDRREPVSHEKKESSADRINRLEKLVEKLVEGNNVSSKNSNYPLPKNTIPELIPSNSAFTTSMWLNILHQECLNKNYDEHSIIRFVQDNMTGIMKSWFKSVSSYDFTWPELKLLITKTFPDNIDFANTLKLLVSRDKLVDETLVQYYFSKLYLCEACKITGQNAVSCLIDGLNNPFIKQELRSYNFLTPEALFSDYLCKLPEGEVPVRMDRREVVTDYPNTEFVNMEVNPQDRESNYRKDNRPICMTCKKIGHVTVNCRHAPICYACRKKGHIAAKCRSSKK